MKTKLAIPIGAKNLQQGKEQIKAAIKAGAEILELRVDYLENLNTEMVKGLIAEVKSSKNPLPIVVTCRDKRQGGDISYPDRLRVEVLVDALEAGAGFIDFEYENFLYAESQESIKRALAQSITGRLILSAHNFQMRFDNIGKLYRHIETLYPAAIPKLVYTANHINDCFEAFDLLHRTSGERIIFCMGQTGLISRIIAKKLGSFITFASIDGDNATASGQLTAEQLKKRYRYDSINAETELYGLIGSPIAHSLSPAVHNACFAKANVDKLYLPLHVQGGAEDFNHFLRNVTCRPWLGFRGFSVTIPHKQNALDYVRENNGSIDPLARRIGAVNTLLINTDGRAAGYNTDCSGALDAITSAMKIERSDLKNMAVSIVGAGGVARAIVAGLSDAGAKIKIYNRTVKKAEKLAGEFACEFVSLDDLQNLQTKLLINCTSVGMYPNVETTAVPKEFLKRGMTVFDTVYNPAETLLLKDAKEKRAKRISGIDMFVNQASAQFKLFTGWDADPKLMRKIVTEKLAPGNS